MNHTEPAPVLLLLLLLVRRFELPYLKPLLDESPLQLQRLELPLLVLVKLPLLLPL
jgi:hypothetical protein